MITDNFVILPAYGNFTGNKKILKKTNAIFAILQEKIVK
jgi:hypothetical protein